MRPRNPGPWALLLLALATGCVGHPATATRPRPATAASPKPDPAGPATLLAKATGTRVVAQTGTPAELTGKVKLISDNGGGLLSDSGGSIISNNAGTLISNNGGSIIANNGGSLVSDAGGGYRLFASHKPVEVSLADAVITLQDARGARLVDGSGQPLMATSDAQGNYRFKAVLPGGNLVMAIQLHEGGLLRGGQLTAMLPQGAHEQPIDAATSLGAAYVLGKFVQGAQATFDKLPASEAEKLRQDLDAAKALITSEPTYTPDALVQLVETLRGQAPPVGQELETIKALLLGQANLGDGRLATGTALYRPQGLALDPQGNVLIGEAKLGRIRYVAPDGTIGTRADVVRGTIKQNFPKMADLAVAADGTLYVATSTALYKVPPGGVETRLAGDETGTHADDAELAVQCLALGPDGTLYLGETRRGADAKAAPRVMKLGADGVLKEIPYHLPWSRGDVRGIAVGQDGSLLIGFADAAGELGTGTLYRGSPTGGDLTPIATGFSCARTGGQLLPQPDGSVWFSEGGAARVTAVAPDGTRKVVAGAGGPAATADLVLPGSLLRLANGTTLIMDEGAGVVRALGSDGSYRVLAGSTTPLTPGTDLRDLPLDAPWGVAFDAQGKLLVSEQGAYRLDRFDGSSFVTFSGTGQASFTGDGGPASQAGYIEPGGMVQIGADLYVADGKAKHVRKIAADGTVTTVIGSGGEGTPLKKGQRVPALEYGYTGQTLAADAHGRLYLCDDHRQIVRLADDGMIELVAGVASDDQDASALDTLTPGLVAALKASDGGPAADAVLLQPRGIAFGPDGALYIAEEATLQIKKVTGLDGPNPLLEHVAGTSVLDAFADLEAMTTTVEGGDARTCTLAIPSGVAVDRQGNVYVSELGSVSLPLLVALGADKLPFTDGTLPPVYARVRKITPDGKIATVAGPNGKFFTAPTAEDALVLPTALAIAPDGRLVIVDSGANLVRILPQGSY